MTDTNTKVSVEHYIINLKEDQTPANYLSTTDGAAIPNGSIIFFIYNDGTSSTSSVFDLYLKYEDNSYLIAGFNQFFHLKNNTLKETEVATTSKIGLMSTEMVKNLNAVVELAGVDQGEGRFNTLQAEIDDVEERVAITEKSLDTYDEKITNLVNTEVENMRESIYDELNNIVTKNIKTILNEFINHTHDLGTLSSNSNGT